MKNIVYNMNPDDYDDGTEYDEDYWEPQKGYLQALREYRDREADLYDIIVAVRLHAETVTECPFKSLENFANATLLEAVPCGSRNICLGLDMSYVEGVINDLGQTRYSSKNYAPR